MLWLAAAGAAASPGEIARLEDPAGDDHGDGTLVYPQHSGYEPGDLDLRALRVQRDGERYRFEAEFRNPVRGPDSVAGDAGPESLAAFARRGFYAFNLDIYIDLDRIAGSGNTYTLPGRGATIDPGHAWEKAVILTPRPELMRRQLAEAVAAQEQARDPGTVAARVDASVFFATDVRVRKRSIAFSVPAAFLGDGLARAEGSVVAFVTGAPTTIRAELSAAPASESAVEALTLGVLQPRPGRPRDSFGYTGIATPSPIVDLLAPAPIDQAGLLKGIALPGVPLGARALPSTSGEARPVTRLAVPPPAADPAPPAPPKADIADRLRSVDELREQGLISEEERQALRRRILSEL